MEYRIPYALDRSVITNKCGQKKDCSRKLNANCCLKDEFGQPVAENYIDKMVTVQNTGKSDAYVRAYFAIPSAKIQVIPLNHGINNYKNSGL